MPDAGIDITSFGAHSVYLTNKIRSQLIWWQDNINPYKGRSISDILGLDDWQFEMYTDASISEWGASLFQAGDSISKTNGYCLKHEKSKHINFLEVQASQVALSAFHKFIINSSI